MGKKFRIAENYTNRAIGYFDASATADTKQSRAVRKAIKSKSRIKALNFIDIVGFEFVCNALTQSDADHYGCALIVRDDKLRRLVRSIYVSKGVLLATVDASMLEADDGRWCNCFRTVLEIGLLPTAVGFEFVGEMRVFGVRKDART